MEGTIPIVNSKINYGLWVWCVKVGPFLVKKRKKEKKKSHLVSDVDSGKGNASKGAGGLWETSVTPSQFCSKPKTA